MQTHLCARNIIAIILGSIVFALSAQGQVLYESASLTHTGQAGGLGIFPTPAPQWLGSRFELDQTANVTSVESQILAFGPGNLFAVIIPLSGPGALPHGAPFDPDEILASATFTTPNPNATTEVVIPMSVTLDPGEYGLVFGSGLFGTSAAGAIADTETDLPGASYFSWYDPQNNLGVTNPEWVSGGFSNVRFVVNGTFVPEPVTSTLLVPGFFLLAARRRGR